MQPPYDTLLPAWIYLVVNAAVVLCAALVRIVVIVTSNPVVRAWIGLANSTENELG
ncbi:MULTISPECIES: hypothetical protein [unclassified Rathayibacter]|uniref:hypothetical protein n=1 Tax=unclassified Rathayibacter TaxID=2609250 RepID=UPI00188B074E|nr:MULTISPECIES: hypothetical protein [unclassified Rathayibacter]MBF4462667.1 hypothetical protein [Rathayibacter sp. VKM Ac-2879]MBF4504081.1 hypothetical protein [Rathayibacter sp. VKM Ac-2878]